MVDKRALNPASGTLTNVAAGNVIGTVVPANMRRYIYKLKVNNEFAGANELTLGYSADNGVTLLPVGGLDRIPFQVVGGIWNDPDELSENALPIYIIPAGNQISGLTDNGIVRVYVLYEDSE